MSRRGAPSERSSSPHGDFLPQRRQRPPPPPFGYPFVGTQPIERTRESFKRPANKDSLEKTRLASRRESHWRAEVHQDPVRPDEESLSYMDDRERFTRDMAKVEHAENIGRMLDRQIKYARKRQDTYNREQARYQARQDEARRDADAARRLQERNVARNNTSSVDYNPITLRYNDTTEGAELKFQDDCVRYRGAMRARNLYEKKSCQAFNIITGEDSNADSIVPVPERPQRRHPSS